MNDIASPKLGHNNPPAFDQEALDAQASKVSDFLDTTKEWLQLKVITTEEQAGQLTDQINGLRGLWKKVDTERKDAKQPHDAAGKAVQEAFKPLLDRLTTATDKLKPKLAAYASAKAAKEAEERRAAEAKARAEAEAAAERQRLAEAEGDVEAEVAAQEAQEAAEKAAKEARRPVSGKVKSASGGGHTMSLRETKHVEVTNVRLLFMHYQKHPDVLATLQRIATAEVRAAGFDQEKTPIPGIDVIKRETMA